MNIIEVKYEKLQELSYLMCEFPELAKEYEKLVEELKGSEC